MKPTILLIALITLFIETKAQWLACNTNTTQNLYGLFFLDSLEGYCVGGTNEWGSPESKGIILKTTDGGENWNTIFSKDSLTIKDISIAEVNEKKILYAFAVNNGRSYLVSTFINPTSQNLTVKQFDHKPKNIKVFNNEIFFIDEIDHLLKKLTNGIVENISSRKVALFDISKDGLIYLESSFESIFYSVNHLPPFSSLPPYPQNIFTDDQKTNALILIKGDTLIIKGTYPGMVLYSFDESKNWTYNLNAPDLKSYIDTTNLYIYTVTNTNQVKVSVDFGLTWTEVFSFSETPILTNLYFNDNRGYVFGENGSMYRNDSIISEIKEIKLGRQMNIYPNPAKDNLQLTILDNIKIERLEMYNTEGKRVKIFENNERSLNLSGVAPGTYFLRITTTNGAISKKVVVE